MHNPALTKKQKIVLYCLSTLPRTVEEARFAVELLAFPRITVLGVTSDVLIATS